MNVRKFISEKKEQFMTMRSENKKVAIQKETARLEKIKAREAELAKANQEKMRVQKELAKYQDINKKASTSKLKSFGKGLASVMNKASGGIQEAKKAGFMKGIDLGGSSSKSPFGSSGKGFDYGQKKTEKPKDKTITIKIKQ